VSGLEIAAVTEGTATLAAAIVAAIAAVASLGVTTFSAYRREMRNAQRDALQPHLASLANAIHQTVATSFNQQKAQSPAVAERWRSRGKESAKTLESVRLAVRYPLPGLDEGLKNLTRVPDWVAHRRGQPSVGELLAHADSLATALHATIEASWRLGRPPGWLRRRRLTRRVNALRAVAPIGPKTTAAREDNATGIDA
jgi:hypothetical protein